jgi:hypothetical protein
MKILFLGKNSELSWDKKWEKLNYEIEFFDFNLDFLSFCKIIDCFYMIFWTKPLFFLKSGIFLL